MVLHRLSLYNLLGVQAVTLLMAMVNLSQAMPQMFD